MKPVKLVRKLRLNTWAIVSRAIEEGAAGGVNRAYKHTDTPSREHIAEQVVTYVMNALDEVVDYDAPQ